MRTIGFVLLLALLLSACGKKADPVSGSQATTTASAPVKEKPKTAAPDFGGITRVSRDVDAIGSTLELAVVAALQSAVAQVNGVRVASQVQSVRAGLDIAVDGKDAGSERAEAFMQKVIAASQGSVIGYEILSQEEVDKIDEETIARVRASDGGYSYSASGSASANYKESSSGSLSASENADARAGDASAAYSSSFSGDASHKAQASYKEEGNLDIKRGKTSYESDAAYRKMRSYWKVRIRADIAQYKAPEEKGRPKIVVAIPRTLSVSYAVGDGSVSSSEVARAVRGRLSDVLTQTKRFIVLDREFGDELQAEVDHINSGNVRVEDSARLGQQLATDLVLIPTIERFEYPRHVQKLRMSDRELVSYTGGGRITLRLLNATTGEVVMSDSFEHKLAAADPSTMPRIIDGKSMAAEMMDTLSGQIGSAIVNRIFPVSVVALNGDQVVLSQGGESLSVGQRWHAVYLGEELKDPQTGLSLGRNEMPVGTIRVDRVSTQTSYGTLEAGEAALGNRPFKPGAIELRKVAAVVDKIESARDEVDASAKGVHPVNQVDRQKPRREAPQSSEPRQEADKPPPPDKDSNW